MPGNQSTADSTAFPPSQNMYMFCGDSHVRQFYYDGPGQFSLTSFTGGTMKGLATVGGPTGHRETILALAAVPRQKTLLLMFGNVDLDVTWFRKSILEGKIDEDDFFQQRLDALTAFLTDCRRVAGGFLRRTCVILPHLPTLTDPYFVRSTATMMRLREDQVIELTSTQDCSHLARCRRTSRFNDCINEGLPSDAAVAVYRIDDQMADETGLILPEFLRRAKRDNHPANEATLPLWYELLKEEVPPFRKLYERHLRRAALAESDRTERADP